MFDISGFESVHTTSCCSTAEAERRLFDISGFETLEGSMEPSSPAVDFKRLPQSALVVDASVGDYDDFVVRNPGWVTHYGVHTVVGTSTLFSVDAAAEDTSPTWFWWHWREETRQAKRMQS